MHFLTNPLVNLALQHFDHLDSDEPQNGDWFFETFGPGNLPNATDRPHERFQDYEQLLKLLFDRDRGKYEKIHKGTPFYFLAWLAFDLRNYEKTLFYIDAAISEDVRNARDKWMDRPAAAFLKLDYKDEVAERVIRKIHDLLSAQVARFNGVSRLKAISVDEFLTKFVSSLIHTASTRTIISAFYIFLLEFEERLKELNLRSIEGGSIGTLIAHMFSGGLIFESLLKHIYPSTETLTLRQIFQTAAFVNDFRPGISTRATSLKGILDAISDDTMVTAFNTTAKLRNTTGHNLVWDDIFDNSANYEALVNQELNALFYVIQRKFL